MSPRGWISSITAGAIVWLIIFGIAAGWHLASRGQLVVLHLGGRP